MTSLIHSHSHCEHIHANALLCLEKIVPVKFATTSLTIFLPLFGDSMSLWVRNVICMAYLGISNPVSYSLDVGQLNISVFIAIYFKKSFSDEG